MKNLLLGISLATGISSCAGTDAGRKKLQPAAVTRCIDAHRRFTAIAVRAMEPNSAICYSNPQFLNGVVAAVREACSPLISDPAHRAEFNDSLTDIAGRICAEEQNQCK